MTLTEIISTIVAGALIGAFANWWGQKVGYRRGRQDGWKARAQAGTPPNNYQCRCHIEPWESEGDAGC